MNDWLDLDPSGRYATARARMVELQGEAAASRRARRGDRPPRLAGTRTALGRWLVRAGMRLLPEHERPARPRRTMAAGG